MFLQGTTTAAQMKVGLGYHKTDSTTETTRFMFILLSNLCWMEDGSTTDATAGYPALLGRILHIRPDNVVVVVFK